MKRLICIAFCTIFVIVSTVTTQDDKKEKPWGTIKLYLWLKAILVSKDNQKKQLDIKKQAEIDIDDLCGLLDADLTDDDNDKDEENRDEDLIKLFFEDVAVNNSSLTDKKAGGSMTNNNYVEKLYQVSYALDIEFKEADDKIQLKTKLKGFLFLFQIKKLRWSAPTFGIENDAVEITLTTEEKGKDVTYSSDEGILKIWGGKLILDEEEIKEKLQENVNLYLELKANLTSEDKQKKELNIKKRAEVDFVELLKLLAPDLDGFDIEFPLDEDGEEDGGQSLIKLFFKDASVDDGSLSYRREGKGHSNYLPSGISKSYARFEACYQLETQFNQEDTRIELEAILRGILHLCQASRGDIKTFSIAFAVQDKITDVTVKTKKEGKEITYTGEGDLKIWTGCKLATDKQEN